MASKRRAAVLAASILAGHSAAAHAEEPAKPVRVALVWRRAKGAERCIAPAEMVTKTRAQASPDTQLTLDRGGADFVVVGQIEPSAEGFRTELVLRDAAGRRLGERTFDSKARSCRALDESLILALALLVETPRVREATSGREAESIEELSPQLREGRDADAMRSPPLAAPHAPRRDGRPWSLELGIGASMVVGFIPKPTVGPTISAAVRPPGLFPIVLRVAGYPLGAERVTIPGEGITLRGGIAGIEACPIVVRRSAIEARGCSGVHIGALFAEPLGPRTYGGELFFVVLPLRAEVRARVGAIEPYAGITGRFAPAPPAFVYGPAGGVERSSFRVPWATFELDLGLAWRAIP